jgi:hypothetical protein
VDSTLISILSLLASNAVAYYGVTHWGWYPSDLLLLYWFENVAVGAVSLLMMWRLPAAKEEKKFMMPFFCLHFGMFTAVHFIFLVVMISIFASDDGGVFAALWRILPAVAAIFVSHAASFLAHHLKPTGEEATMDYWFIQPYKRVVVMHLVVIFGFFVAMQFNDLRAAALLLVVLKTGVDLGLHILSHRKKFA